MAKSDAFYSAFVEIVPTADGFSRRLQSEIDGPVKRTGSNAGGAFSGAFVGGMGGGLKKALVTGGGILAAAGGAAAIGEYFANAIDNASTYQQAQGAVEDVFGQLGADAIKAFAEGGAQSVGQSMNDILGSAKDFGIFGRAAGLAEDELVGFSTNLITLAADLSAFADTTPQQAVEALAAGLRGESEPLRQYGVLLDDATLRMKALELGIYDGNGSLTQQQRILAANAVIMDQTAIQQGKFAAEADTLAARQAVLAASLENVSTTIGTAFLPMVEDVVQWVSDEMVPALEDFAAWLNEPETQQGLRDWGQILGFVGEVAKTVGLAIVDTAGMIGVAVGIVNGQRFDEIVARLVELPGFWGDVFRAANDMATGIGAAIGTSIFRVRQFASEVGTNINNAISFVRSLPSQVASAVGNAGSWLYNAGRQVIEGFINGITSMVRRIYGAVQSTVGGAIDAAKSLLGIASPSKVFAEIGRFTSQGFAVGIESEFRSVRAATAGMTGAAQQGVSMPDSMSLLDADGSLLGRMRLIAGNAVAAYDGAQSRADNAGIRRRFA